MNVPLEWASTQDFSLRRVVCIVRTQRFALFSFQSTPHNNRHHPLGELFFPSVYHHVSQTQCSLYLFLIYWDAIFWIIPRSLSHFYFSLDFSDWFQFALIFLRSSSTLHAQRRCFYSRSFGSFFLRCARRFQ